MADKKNKNKNKTKKTLGQKILKKKVVASIPTEWYYMSPDRIKVEDIMEILGQEAYDIHMWKEMGILEINFKGEAKGALDVETCELDLGDEFSNEYLKEHDVKSLFYFAFKAEDEADSIAVMKKIVEKKSGLFCADTEDFSPVIS